VIHVFGKMSKGLAFSVSFLEFFGVSERDESVFFAVKEEQRAVHFLHSIYVPKSIFDKELGDHAKSSQVLNDLLNAFEWRYESEAAQTLILSSYMACRA
jgi:hypothetical protein